VNSGQQSEQLTIYICDTGVFIQAAKFYPRDAVAPLWEALELLIQAGRLIAPEQVYEELHQQSDELTAWADLHEQLFRPTDILIIEEVKVVLREFSDLGEVLSTQGPAADPWVVALARMEKARQEQQLWGVPCMVLTQEKRYTQKTQAKPRIPMVCDHYGIECGELLDLIRLEGIFGTSP
jgi:Domain of unknown function (DUF4411)